MAYDPKKVDYILKLRKPFETLILSQKIFHAVTPMGTTNKNDAFRDILLVTFQGKKVLDTFIEVKEKKEEKIFENEIIEEKNSALSPPYHI